MGVLPNVCGIAPATYNGRKLVEKQMATEALSAKDIHFGLNGDMSTLVTDASINTYGPRALDIAERGGDVAETIWFKWQADPTATSVTQFLTFFDDIGGRKAPRSKTYPVGAQVTPATPVGGDRKYAHGATDKKMASLSNEASDGAGYQLGTRWSKVSLEIAIKNGGKVHFHLDGMGDIANTIGKTGGYNYSVTSRELRYVYRNRGRKAFFNHVVFYNGYYNVNGKYRPAIVNPPW